MDAISIIGFEPIANLQGSHLAGKLRLKARRRKDF
jgi:hypothetical protein